LVVAVIAQPTLNVGPAVTDVASDSITAWTRSPRTPPIHRADRHGEVQRDVDRTEQWLVIAIEVVLGA
jgi:hypothetical protein